MSLPFCKAAISWARLSAQLQFIVAFFQALRSDFSLVHSGWSNAIALAKYLTLLS